VPAQLVNGRFLEEIHEVSSDYFPSALKFLNLSHRSIFVWCAFRPSQEIAKLEQQQKASKSVSAAEVCPEHDLPLSYFCQPCVAAICSDCALFGGKVSELVILMK